MLNRLNTVWSLKSKIRVSVVFRHFVSIQHKMGELNWPLDFQGPLPKEGTDSPEGPLSVSGGYLFLGSKVWEMGEAEKCPHPREPRSETPTAQIGGWEMIVIWVP